MTDAPQETPPPSLLQALVGAALWAVVICIVLYVVVEGTKL
jgi:hypothetical protein